MSDRTQDLKNHRQVAVACKNYTDSEIKKSEGRILSIVARNNVDFIDHTDEATYRFTAPANAKLLMLQSIAGNSVKYSPSVASDSTTAYQKNVPSYSPSIDRASANINTLGGMSYKCNNLFDSVSNYSYIGADVSLSNNTIIYNALTNSENALLQVQLWNNDNYDSTVGNFTLGTRSQLTFTKPSTANNIAIIRRGVNDYYYVAYNISNLINGNTYTISIDSNNAEYNQTLTVSNIMLNEGSTALPYEPYYSGIRDNAPTSVKSVGANLAGETIIENQGYAQDGGTYSSNDTNIMTLIEVKPNTTYSKNNDYWLNYYDENRAFIRQEGAIITFTTPSNCKYIGITIPKTVPNLMLNYGSTALPYKEYVGTIDTLPIPAQVQALDGYGWGINDTCYNYIDFNAKKFNKIVNKVDLSTLTFTIRGDGTFYGASSSSLPLPKENSNILSAKYSYGNPYANPDDNLVYVFVDGGQTTILIRDTSSGGNITGYLYYEQVTIVETDISQYLDGNEIEIEPNGTLSFESTYSAYVPSNVSYNGVIKHALATAVKQDGFNVWDEEWESGRINYSNGNLVTDSDYIRSKNYISVLPNTAYYFLKGIYGTGTYDKIIYYDKNYNYVDYYDFTSRILTMPSNVYYVKFCVYGTTYNNDICINISNQDLNGTYKPYKAPITRLLPNSEAKYSWGITDGVRNTRVFCDDEGNAVNEGQLDVGNQDLDSLEYRYDSSSGFMYATISDIKSITSGMPNALSNTNYTLVASTDLSSASDKSYTTYTAGVYFKDSAYTDTTLFKNHFFDDKLLYQKNATDTETLDDFDYFFDCEEGDTFTLVNTEQLQCYATYSFLIKEARTNE